jgi:anti-sigma B factor antagonist
MYRSTVHLRRWPQLRRPESAVKPLSRTRAETARQREYDAGVPELHLSVEPYDAGVVVAVAGELDVTSSQRFSDCLTEAATHSDRVVLDMSKVDFMDTTALAVIVGAWRRQAEDGGLFLLAGARYRYTKALWITGLADRMPMYDSVEAALAAAAGGGEDGGEAARA